MSNQYLKLRRSAIPGKIPETSSIDFGEIALNTYDGLAFIKKSGSLGEEIVVLGIGASTSGSFTGSFSGSFTGSLLGTASWAQNATTASYVVTAQTASYVLQAVSSSFATNAANATTASYILNAISASYAATASIATSASFASTASSADNFTVRGTLTAQTIVAQTITSSTDFVTGSTRFGSLSSNTHQFTGSVSVTGSLSVNNSSVVTGIGTSGQVAYWNGTTSQTGSTKLTYDGSKLTVGTSGNAIPGAITIARFVNNTDGSDVEINGNGYARLYFNDYSRGSDLKYYEMLNYETNFKISRLNDGNSIRSERLTIFGATGNVFIGSSPVDGGFKFDVSGSTRLNGNTQITGSLTVTQGITGSLFGTSSWAANAVTSSYILNAVSASFATTASYWSGSILNATSASFASTASYVLDAVSASYASNGGVTQIVAGTNVTISPTSGTGSVTINAAAGAAFPFTGSALITGSLTVTGSIFTTSTLNVGTSQFNNTASITSAGTTIISQLATGSYTSCFYNYTIASASNARSGQVMSVWNGATVRYTEVTTTDIGNTATASFAVALSGANIQLNFTAPGSWTVKNIANLL